MTVTFLGYKLPSKSLYGHNGSKEDKALYILRLTNTKESIFLFIFRMGQSFLCLVFISFKFCSNSRLNCSWTEVTNFSHWHVSGLQQHCPLAIPQGVQQKSTYINIHQKTGKLAWPGKLQRPKKHFILHLIILFLEGVISMTLILVWKYIFFIVLR